MTEGKWIKERVHWLSHLQDGPGGTQPVCAALTGVIDAPTTSDVTAVTCDACAAMNMAMERGRHVRINLGLVTRQVVRVGVQTDAITLSNLTRTLDIPGVRPVDVLTDEGNATLWIALACEGEEVIRQVIDTSDLPVKSHGEFYE